MLQVEDVCLFDQRFMGLHEGKTFSTHICEMEDIPMSPLL